MLIKRLKLSAIIILTTALGLYAQESFNAAGGNASDNGGSVSYSVGQVTYLTQSGTNYSVSEGVQQAYEISVVSTIEEAEGITLTAIVYPNPVADYLSLILKEFEISNMSYLLYNLDGKILQSGIIDDNQTNIAMGNLVASTYLLSVIQNNKEVKSFIIIKK
ncbi:MAG: T9SS type A sorting domain-containing protein [Bacteroidales bacterium]|nr:T9SS type A sorting domain-containing protein [Bacteroidales bacterium]